MVKGELRNDQNADAICDLIVEGLTLRQIGRKIGCTAGAIIQWVAAEEEFAKRYARAKLAQADLMAEDIIDISDDVSNDWMEIEGEMVLNKEHINRSRLRVDTRKFLMVQLAPKKYGNKIAVTGDGGGPLVVQTVSFNDDDPPSS